MNTFKIILLTLIILTVNISLAQYDKDKNRMRGQLDSLMKEKITSETGIDEATADKFFSLYRENNKQIRELKKEKKEVMKIIKADPGALDVETKIDNLYKIESEILEKRKSFIEELKIFLTPQQIASTIVFMQEFSKKFRKRFKKDRKNMRNNDYDMRQNDFNGR